MATKSLLTEYRSDLYWKKVYDYAVEVAKLHGIPIAFLETGRRKRKRPSHLDDTVILQTVGSHDRQCTSEQLKLSFYLPVLDNDRVR